MAEEARDIVDRLFPRFEQYNPRQSALIPLLQGVQAEMGYLSNTALERTAEILQLPLSHVYGVATFYHQFRLRPRGKHMITVCRGTACHVGGSLDIYNLLIRQLGISPPEDTSKDRLFTLQQARCLGACGLAPIMKIDDDVYGKTNPTRIRQIISKYR
jgi:NADH-quinone oxidoreductase subunit E